MPRVLIAAVLLTLLAAGFPAFAQADQEQAPPPIQNEAGSVEPKKIPTAHLASSLDAANASLRELRAKLASIPATANVEDAFSGVAEDTRNLLVRHQGVGLDTLSLPQLDLMSQQWARTDAKLEAWRDTLDARSNNLMSADQALREMRAQWETIFASAESSAVPEELLAQVRSVQNSIEDVDTHITERLSAVLTLVGRLTELRSAVTQAEQEVAAARVLARKRILEPDSPSLWDALLHPRARISWSQQVEDTFAQDTEQYEIFMGVYRRRVPLQILFFFAMSLLMVALWLRFRKREGSEKDSALHTARQIFSRPFSAALALTLASTRLFYPQAPLIIYETNILFALIPVLRLVPRLTVTSLHPAVYGLSALFAMNQIHAMAADETILQRLILFLTSLSGLAGAVWIVRRHGRASSDQGGRWWNAAVLGIRLSTVLFFASLGANFIGSVALAELLTEATLTSAFGALALAVWVVIVESLLTVAIRSRVARATGMVSRHADVIVSRLTSLVRLVALTAWLAATLNLFRLLEVTLDGAARALSETWTLGNLTISLGSVLAFFSTVLVAVYISRFIRFVLEEDVFPRLPLQRGVPATLSMLINYSILTLGFLSAMAVAGIEVSQFAIIFGALGVGIGFGLQNVVNNFISGLILVFERPVKIGDTIEVGTMLGEVRRIGIRSSTVRTYDGAEVIVPNGNLISAEVINWTLSDRMRRIKIPVGVAYGTDPQKVLDLLVDVARGSSDVLKFPEAQALFLGFGESSLDFELRFWTANFDNWIQVSSQVTVDVNTALGEAGIEIPFPQRDLHLRSAEPEAGQALSGTDRR